MRLAASGSRGGRLISACAAAWALAATFAASTTAAQNAPAPASGATIWAGVFAEEQAKRGEKVADTYCVGCHGGDLGGGDSGPKLVGEEFMALWRTLTVAELFMQIKESMPGDTPGLLSPEKTADVIAYIFKLNGLPAGVKDLPTDLASLKEIAMVEHPPGGATR